MKNLLLTVSFALTVNHSLLSQDSTLRTLRNEAFKAGETLEYRVHYGFINAGEAKMEIMPEIKDFGRRKVFHIVGTGRTLGAFDWFFKVRDRYESYVDTQAIIPWYFIRRVDEGGYKISQNVTFNQYMHKAISEKATIDIPNNLQDIVSAYYYCRTLNADTLKPGDLFPLHSYLDDEVVNVTLKYLGKEEVKVSAGTFKCLKFRPMLLLGRVFKEEDDMTVWVSDDKNKIVIRAEAEILVGSVKMDLKKYSGLANAFTAKVK